MKIAVMGAGGVGGYYGGRLAAAGNDVAFVGRGAHLDAITQHGLKLVGPDEELIVDVKATDDPERVGVADVVIFAVKLYDSEVASKAIAPLVGEATRVLTLQNGIDGGETLARDYGAHRVWAGPAYVSARIVEPGVIRHFGGPARVRFGTWDRGPDPIADTFAAACNAAGFVTELVEDAREPLWTKFVLLATNGGLSAAARLPIADIYKDPRLREQAIGSMREVAAVARAEGAPVADDVVEQCVAYADNISPGVRASICNDLLRGGRIEVEGLSGVVVRLAAKHGIDVPIHRTLYALLKPYENGPIDA